MSNKKFLKYKGRQERKKGRGKRDQTKTNRKQIVDGRLSPNFYSNYIKCK